MTDHDQYFDYLQGRSRIGGLYRRFWLYPHLCRHLKGQALDIGCGLGDMLAFRKNTVGVDINDKTVAWCRQRGLEAFMMLPDVLPFDADSFDSVVMDNVLEHIANPSPILAEVMRVLKPGGVLLVGVPGARGFASDPDHKVFYDAQKLTATLAQAGFQPRKLFAMPISNVRSLSNRIRQFCLYGVFGKE